MNALIGFAEVVIIFALVFGFWLGCGIGLTWALYWLARLFG